jgi:hypothetical protein
MGESKRRRAAMGVIDLQEIRKKRLDAAEQEFTDLIAFILGERFKEGMTLEQKVREVMIFYRDEGLRAGWTPAEMRKEWEEALRKAWPENHLPAKVVHLPPKADA